MIEIIWLGRGGQGAFTSAKLLGAAFTQNPANSALAFPTFGPERRGAPIKAYTKLDTQTIKNRSATTKADYIVVLDDTLYDDNILNLLKENGHLLINSKKQVNEIIQNDSFKEFANKIVSIDANNIALQHKLPVVNTIMMAYLSKLFNLVNKDNLIYAIENYMPPKLHTKNINVIQDLLDNN